MEPTEVGRIEPRMEVRGSLTVLIVGIGLESTEDGRI